MKEELRLLLLQAMGNKGKVLGTAFGFAVGLAALHFGVLRALVFGLLTLGGYFVGERLDGHRNLLDLVERFFPPS